MLRHSIEVAFIAGMLADEMGLDGALARRCGLLHDIGKAADHEAEGGHPKIGADLLKRYGERPEVIHAAIGHHDDLRLDNPYTVLVAAADACSASRPGARRETLERYVKRMEELESIATSFTGVEQAFAIQAGRELRVMVNAKDTTDETAAKICHDIATGLRGAIDLPRRDQSNRAAGDAACGVGAVRTRSQINVAGTLRGRSVRTAQECACYNLRSLRAQRDLAGTTEIQRTACGGRRSKHRRKPPISSSNPSRKSAPCVLLLIGDIVGKPGRQICAQALPRTADRGAPGPGRGQRRERGGRLGPDARHLSRAVGRRRRLHHAGRPCLPPPRDFSHPAKRAEYRPAGQLSARGPRP